MRAVASLLLSLALAGAATAQPASAPRPDIPFKDRAAAAEVETGRVVGALVLLLALGLGGLWLVRRRGAGPLPRTQRRLRLVESLRVSPRTTVLLVEVDGQPIVLAEQAGAVVQLRAPSPSATPLPGQEAPHA